MSVRWRGILAFLGTVFTLVSLVIRLLPGALPLRCAFQKKDLAVSRMELEKRMDKVMSIREVSLESMSGLSISAP